MARSSQTELAVLGVLSVEPMTGYAIREAIRDVLGHFWSESFGQIYPALGRLEASGLVRREGSSRARASAFALTESGRLRLGELLREPPQQAPPRNGLLLRLFFGRELGVEACRDLLRDARDDAQRRLEAYAAVRAEITADDAHADERPFWLLTVTAGEHTARATLEWAEASLTALVDPDDRNPG